MPVDIVLERARSGQIHSKSENGFTFIDVAPDGDECDPPLHPPTFASVTPAELVALHDPQVGPQVEPQPEDWRAVRQVTSRSRRPPAQVPRTLP
jgi:hypothetical protein